MRIALEADTDAVTETIALAFATDPVWGAALARPDGNMAHHLEYWRVFVEGAIPHGMVFRSDDDAAVAVWIPPGVDEVSDAGEQVLRAIVAANLDAAAQQAMFELWERFEAHHPRAEPYAYLSLLATHPDHRGQGIAQSLVRENLAEFDRRHLPTYLESTNPANDHRYERLGFVKIGDFAGSVDGSRVSTMWRAIP